MRKGTTFLTSSFVIDGGDSFSQQQLMEKNGFASQLRAVWPESATLLYVASDPDNFTMTDKHCADVRAALEGAGLAISRVEIADHRTYSGIGDLLKNANVVYLAGGHAPTQLRYIRQLHLRQALEDFEGIIIGLSAGSLNAANNVYMIPELEGETLNPEFIRFTTGLGLTDISIIPHYDYFKNVILDGKRYIEEIVMPDSIGRSFYFITDGSFFKIQGDETWFYGDGSIISDKQILPLKSGSILPVSTTIPPDIWRTLADDIYDFIFTLDTNTGICSYLHIGQKMGNILHGSSLRYEDFVIRLSLACVEEEQSSIIDQARLSVVKAEVAERGNFVRTMHTEAEDRRIAKLMRINPIPGRDGILLVTLFDITTALDHDWMTDEYARTGFLENARKALYNLPYDTAYSLVYTNVRGFKAVNEMFGNESGDMVIFLTRDVLRRRLFPIIMGRLESDHFVMLVERDRLSDANLRALTCQTFSDGNRQYNFDITCGIYDIHDREVSITTMIDRAKLAEKTIRDNGVVSFARFDDCVQMDYMRRRILLSDMKSSMESGEIMPFFQPTVRADNGEVVSAEALVRWYHHDMGMVSPAEFIPVIEHEGRISSLDIFMMDQALELTIKRHEQGLPMVPVAVNLSRMDFYDSYLMEFIKKSFSQNPLAAQYIHIEVTESAYADLEKRAMDYLNDFKSMGIKILLDDFGSGMSSLSTLETFAFDIVKLDMGFIRKIGIRPKAEAIIESTIKLAHALGATVTAEGVETEKQLEFLRRVGCDHIQGFYFYKPMALEDFLKILDKNDPSSRRE